MLDIIRSNAQSFWVKVAFGVIILVFVFWGIGSFTDTGNVNIVGTVNGEPITYQQFEMSYRRAEEAINQQSPRRTWTAEEKSQLGRQVFQQLVVERLIVQEARRNNIDISPYELRLYVGQLKEFQDAQGKFDPERYKNVLAATRQTPASFEEDLTRRLLIEKTVAFVSQGSWTDSLEARAWTASLAVLSSDDEYLKAAPDILKLPFSKVTLSGAGRMPSTPSAERQGAAHRRTIIVNNRFFITGRL